MRLLPPDLYRTCLARCLEVLHDLLASHWHMARWHEAALARHAEELAALQAAAAGGVEGCGGEGSRGEQQQQQQQELAAPSAPATPVSPNAEAVAVTGRAVMQLQRGTASEVEELSARAEDEAEWGAVLRAVHAGLVGGRAQIWEEAARWLGVLLSSPAAFEGEHFMQV